MYLSCRRWSVLSGSCAARSSSTGTARPALSLRPPSVHRAEIVGHGLDLLLGPQRAASDHAIEHALPAAPVLAVIHPHSRAVALEALGEQGLLARRVRKSWRLRLLLLRERRARQEQRAEQSEQDARRAAQSRIHRCLAARGKSPSRLRHW